MYEIKKQIYLYLTKNQKAALCSFLRALVKKTPELSADEIFDKFIEDESYYLEINNSRFEFIADLMEDETFINDTKLFINECVKYYEYRKKQAPVIQAQKEFKDAPTKKQLYYYEKLCKRYGLEKKDLTSKLEARDEIDRILNEYSRDFENID